MEKISPKRFRKQNLKTKKRVKAYDRWGVGHTARVPGGRKGRSQAGSTLLVCHRSIKITFGHVVLVNHFVNQINSWLNMEIP